MSRARPRVLIVGGPDVEARIELMRRLAESVDVVAVGSSDEVAPRFREAGFEYRSYPMARSINPWTDLASVRALASIFREERPHLVHAFDTKPGIWGPIAARVAGVPHVVATITGLGSLYSSDTRRVRATRRVFEQLLRVSARRCDRIVFQNTTDHRELIEARIVDGDRAVVILGSGVDTEVFGPDAVDRSRRDRFRQELGYAPDDVVVLMVSRLIRTKGVPEFVEAARSVRAAAPRARFLLVGPDDRSSLDRLTDAEIDDLGRHVDWIGPRDDLSLVMAASDVFVLPTAYREGIPRVLLEAGSMGLTLVSTDSAGCNEVVKDRVNGRLITPGPTGQLGEVLLELVGEPGLRAIYGEASRQLVVREFDIDRVAGQTLALYEEVLAQRGTPTSPSPVGARSGAGPSRRDAVT